VDNPRGAPVVTFGPSTGLTASCLIGGLLLGVLAAFDGDSAGRLLVGLAALLLITLGCYDAVVSPRLVASAKGLTVRTAGLRAELPWTAVEDLRLDERSRLGLASRTLEIDAGVALVVLGRHSLGREPREVFDLVSAFRP
jgi:Bacterial PH domain